MGTRLYVGNLPFSTSEESLREMFGKVGTVVNCNVISDKYTGKSRGFAFVEMSTQEEANRGVSEFNGKEVDGRALTVNEARPREERSRREGGMGDRGGYGGHRDRDRDYR